MNICPNCKNSIDETAVFCAVCGANVVVPQGASQMPQQPTVDYAPPVQPQGAQSVPPQGVPYYTAPQQQQPVVDNTDHTNKFDTQDIADNKLMAMLVYLLGIVGVIVALLNKKESAYLNFHIKQGIKFVVVETLVSLATVLLCWTCVAPVIGGIFLVVIEIVRFICFYDVCNGKAKDAVIIRGLKFLD